MNAKTKRLDALYEREVERWRGEWDRFEESAWRPLETRVLECFNEACDLSEEEWTAFQAAARALADTEPADAKGDPEAWAAWWEAANETWPLPGEVRLDLWPTGLPEPPPEAPASWAYESELFAATKDDPARRFDALVSAYGLVMLALARGVRAIRAQAQHPN